MKSKGWVKLWREQFSHEISERKPWCDGYAWSYLYSQANHKPGIVNFRNQYIPVERGQFITSKQKLQRTFGWSKKRTNSFLTSLEVGGMSTNRGTNRYLLITICNYDKFQSNEEEKEPTEGLTEGPTESRQRATNKNDKNEKKRNADSRISTLVSFFSEEVLSSRGWKPEIDGGDAKAVQRALRGMTEEEIREAVSFYLGSEKAKTNGVTLKAALSTHSLNFWRQQREGRNWQQAI